MRVSALTRVATEASAGIASIRDYHWPGFGILYRWIAGGAPLSFLRLIVAGFEQVASMPLVASLAAFAALRTGRISLPRCTLCAFHIVLGLALARVRLVACLLSLERPHQLINATCHKKGG